MNLLEAQQELLDQIDAGNSLLIASKSGVGKSQMVGQTFSQVKSAGRLIGEKWGWRTMFAATQTPTDLIGVQWKGERPYPDGKGGTRMVTVTDPALPLWMISDPHEDDEGGKPAWCYDRFFLFIDEYGQGELDTKRALAEVFLNKGTAPHYLPKRSVVVGATNIGARYGVTKDFDFCIPRRVQIWVDGDAQVWEDGFASKPYFHEGVQWEVSRFTRAWAQTHPQFLFEDEPKEQGPFCNPRTLTMADRSIQVRARKNNGIVPLDDFRLLESLNGTIGHRAAERLMADMKAALLLPSYQEVVADPMGCKVPEAADQMLMMVYETAHHVKVEHIKEVLAYVTRLAKNAKDLEVTFVTQLLRKDFDRVIGHPAMQAWVNKNAALVNVIAATRN